MNGRTTLKGLSGHFRKDHLRTVASHSSLSSVDSFTSLLPRIIGNGGSQHTFFFLTRRKAYKFIVLHVYGSLQKENEDQELLGSKA